MLPNFPPQLLFGPFFKRMFLRVENWAPQVNLHFRQLGCSFSVGFLLLAAEGFAQVVRRMGAPLRLAALEVEKNHRKASRSWNSGLLDIGFGVAGGTF